MADFAVMKPDNLLIYQKEYTPDLLSSLIAENNLDGLRIFDHLDPLSNIDFLNHCTFLKKLSIATRYDHGFEYLKLLTNLTDFSSQVIGTSVIDLSSQANLERLSLEWHKKVVGIDSCKRLKRLGLVNFTEENLLKVKSLTSLETLVIKISTIETLEGIGALLNLKKIVLGNCKRLKVLSALNGLNKLEDLEFDGCPKIKNFSTLTDLPALRALHLLDCKQVDSISFVNYIPSLNQLTLLGNTDVVDGDLIPAKRIKQVSYYHRKHYNERIPTPEADAQQKRNLDKLNELRGN